MGSTFNVGDRVRVKLKVPGGTNRTPLLHPGQEGGRGPLPRPCRQSQGPRLRWERASRNYPSTAYPSTWPTSTTRTPDFVRDRVLVDVWEDWLEPAVEERADSKPISREEHELTYYERRAAALQSLLVQKGIMNVDESRRLVAELDFHRSGASHPMVSPIRLVAMPSSPREEAMAKVDHDALHPGAGSPPGDLLREAHHRPEQSPDGQGDSLPLKSSWTCSRRTRSRPPPSGRG